MLPLSHTLHPIANGSHTSTAGDVLHDAGDASVGLLHLSDVAAHVLRRARERANVRVAYVGGRREVHRGHSRVAARDLVHVVRVARLREPPIARLCEPLIAHVYRSPCVEASVCRG